MKSKKKRVFIILMCYFFIVSNVCVTVRAADGSSNDNGVANSSDDYVQGRYAVGTGKPVASTANI